MENERLERIFREAWNEYLSEPEATLNSGSFARWLRRHHAEVAALGDHRRVVRLVQKFLARGGADEVA